MLTLWQTGYFSNHSSLLSPPLYQFHLHANSIRDVTKLHYTVTTESMTDLAAEITASAKKEKSEWPFATMPMFEVNAHHARQLSGVEALALCPLVHRDNRVEWEDYSYNNQWWIEESRSLELGEDTKDRIYEEGSILPFIYRLEGITGIERSDVSSDMQNAIPTPVDQNREVRYNSIRHPLV